MLSSLLLILVLLSLLIIAYQDFRFRGVSWYLFPIAFLLIIVRNLHHVTLKILLENLGLNLLFVLLQLSILIGYFALRKIKVKQFLNQYMGLGDILFFVLMSAALPFPAFPIFMVLSLVFSLILGLLLFKGKTVPLAGIQAFVLAVVMLMDESRSLTNTFPFYVW